MPLPTPPAPLSAALLATTHSLYRGARNEWLTLRFLTYRVERIGAEERTRTTTKSANSPSKKKAKVRTNIPSHSPFYSSLIYPEHSLLQFSRIRLTPVQLDRVRPSPQNARQRSPRSPLL